MRVLSWFSCGSASALAAKFTIDKYRNHAQVLYCDTLKYEHPDNRRFLKDVQTWIRSPIKILKSDKYSDIYDVFDKTGWLVGPGGARCTTELKKKVRQKYERPGDIHVFGFTVEEIHRKERFLKENPELIAEFPLIDRNVTKKMVHQHIADARIRQPAMYRLGYQNNNCIGCVKGQAGYWNNIRQDFPKVFEKMAKQERKMDVAINKKYVDGKRIRVFLDEMPEDMGRGIKEPDIECGVLCIHEDMEK